MRLESVQLPKSSGIEAIKREFNEFIAYYEQAKGRKPGCLYLSTKPGVKLRASIKANLKIDVENFTYEGMKVVQL